MSAIRRLWLVGVIITVCFIGYVVASFVVIKTLEADLMSSQTELFATKEELDSVHDMLSAERSATATLQSELDAANIVIESLSSEALAFDITVTEREIELMAKTMLGEAGPVDRLQQSAVAWCILNRVDAGFGTITQVITAKNQFHGYVSTYPVLPEIKELAMDVVARWKLEKYACGDIGRTLPKEFLYFWANKEGTANVFRTAWAGDYVFWDWDCNNPYEA